MEAAQALAYALIGGGIALIGSAIVAVMSRQVSFRVANHMVRKLVDAGNRDRASKLCSVAGGSYLVAVGAALAASPADAGAAFDEAGRQLVTRWHRIVERGMFGAVFAGGGVALAVSEQHAGTPIWIGGGVAALGAIWLLARRGHMARALAAARHDLLPAIQSPG